MRGAMIELCGERLMMGFGPLAIAEGLAIRANAIRLEGMTQALA